LGTVNVVVVVSGGLAETLKAAPLLRAMASAPSGPPTVVCAPDGADLVRAMGGIGEVVTVAALGGQGGLPGQLWSALRFRRVDVAVVCSERLGVRAAVFTAAVPRRVGCRAGFSDVFLTDAVPCPRDENRQQAWSRLAVALGFALPSAGPLLTPPQAVLDSAEQRLLATGIGDGRLLVAIAPGNAFSARGVDNWSPERYAHLANRLALRHGVGVVLVGDERDRSVAEALRIDLAAEALDLCGEIDLPTTAAVIARCDLLVSADTALLHVAAAVGTSSVGLFARTDGHRRGLPGPQHRIVQATANGSVASLDRIRVEDVLAAIEGAL
jgi:ADP-heptose:LPS heptosyltransferase